MPKPLPSGSVEAWPRRTFLQTLVTEQRSLVSLESTSSLDVRSVCGLSGIKVLYLETLTAFAVLGIAHCLWWQCLALLP